MPSSIEGQEKINPALSLATWAATMVLSFPFWITPGVKILVRSTLSHIANISLEHGSVKNVGYWLLFLFMCFHVYRPRLHLSDLGP